MSCCNGRRSCCGKRKKKVVPTPPATCTGDGPVLLLLNPDNNSTLADPAFTTYVFDRVVTVISSKVETIGPSGTCAGATSTGDAVSLVGATSSVVFLFVDSTVVGQRYRSTITVADAANPLCQTTVQNCFTDGEGCAAPTPLTTVPAEGATVPVPVHIVWTFDVPVTVVSIVVQEVAPPIGDCINVAPIATVTGSVGVVADTVTFTPTVPFQSGKNYRYFLFVAVAGDATCQVGVQNCFATT